MICFKKIDSLTLKECKNITPEDEQKAQVIKARIEFLRNEDRERFSSCSTIEEYEEYIKSSPDGEYQEAAKLCIAELKSKAIFGVQPGGQNKDIQLVDIKQFLDESWWYKSVADVIAYLNSLFYSVYKKFQKQETAFECNKVEISERGALCGMEKTGDVFSEIYNIEDPQQCVFYRRVQNKDYLWGLCKSLFLIKQVLPFEYNDIQYSGGEEFICVKEDKKGVFHTGCGCMVLDAVYDEVEIIKNEYICTKGDRQGVYSTKYQSMILDVVYEKIYKIDDGFICTRNGKMGLYNSSLNRMVLDVEYDGIEVLGNGLFSTVKNQKCQKYNIKGYRIIE